MTGFGGWLGETHREIGSRRIAAGEARTVLIPGRYDAPIEDVWRACTEPEQLGNWFVPVTGDLRAGGTFPLQGSASGEILRCGPPRLLALAWGFGGPPVGQVELRLSPGEGGDTVLELEHACMAKLVERDGRLLDVIADVGAAWEVPLTYALTRYLRGELPDASSAEWHQYNSQDRELGQEAAQPGRPSSMPRIPAVAPKRCRPTNHDHRLAAPCWSVPPARSPIHGLVELGTGGAIVRFGGEFDLASHEACRCACEMSAVQPAAQPGRYRPAPCDRSCARAKSSRWCCRRRQPVRPKDRSVGTYLTAFDDRSGRATAR
jgi:uncharacterized protein YndB with AHSA1/START domain